MPANLSEEHFGVHFILQLESKLSFMNTGAFSVLHGDGKHYRNDMELLHSLQTLHAPVLLFSHCRITFLTSCWASEIVHYLQQFLPNNIFVNIQAELIILTTVPIPEICYKTYIYFHLPLKSTCACTHQLFHILMPDSLISNTLRKHLVTVTEWWKNDSHCFICLLGNVSNFIKISG